MKDFLVTCKRTVLTVCHVNANTSDEAEKIATEEYSKQLWDHEETLTMDIEAALVQRYREGPVNCPACSSSDVVSYDNESLCHDRDYMDDCNVQMDDELHVHFKCHTCEFKFTKTFDLKLR